MTAEYSTYNSLLANINPWNKLLYLRKTLNVIGPKN